MTRLEAIQVLEARLRFEFHSRYRQTQATCAYGRENIVMDRRQIRATVCALRSLRKEAHPG